LEDVVSAISQAILRAEQLTGVPVNRVILGVNGQHIVLQESRGAVAIARPEAEITLSDIERAVLAAKTIAIPANFDILHVLAKSFSVDGQQGIKDPQGMTGVRLEVDATIIETLASHVKNLTKAAARANVVVDGLVYGPLATASAVLSKRQKDLGVCLITLGAATTSIIVFEEGNVLSTAALPFGGDHMTNDIAIGLRISIDAAAKIKHALGTALPDTVDRKEQFSVRDYGVESDEVVKRRFVAEIIGARLEEVFEHVDKHLASIDRSGMLPVGAVIVGDVARLEGVVDVAKRVLRLPCTLGQLTDMDTVVDEGNDPGFLPVVGLCSWGHAELFSRAGGGGIRDIFKGSGDIVKSLRGLFKTFLP
jgi:cell division protein FtsA